MQRWQTITCLYQARYTSCFPSYLALSNCLFSFACTDASPSFIAGASVPLWATGASSSILHPALIASALPLLVESPGLQLGWVNKGLLQLDAPSRLPSSNPRYLVIKNIYLHTLPPQKNDMESPEKGWEHDFAPGNCILLSSSYLVSRVCVNFVQIEQIHIHKHKSVMSSQ